MKKRILLFLCLIFVICCLFGCDKNQSSQDRTSEDSTISSSQTTQTSSTSSSQDATEAKVFYNKNEVEECTESNEYLYYCGSTDYKIVIPDKCSASIQFAANEISNFVSLASNGVVIPIISDVGLSLNPEDKYISIGFTTLFNQSNITLDFQTLSTEGFKIVSVGNTVLINACGENGTIYGAYGFLERNIGYRFYDDDCIKVNKRDSVKMLSYNVCDIPTFLGRHVTTQTTRNRTATYLVRMRMHGGQSESIIYGEGNTWSLLSDQSIVQNIMPYEQYKDNEGWYSGDMLNGQLCLTKCMSDSFMFDTFMTNLINNFIIPEKNRTIFFLGLNDNANKCQCDECLRQYALYKESGVMVRFANKVDDAVHEWQSSLSEGDSNKNRKIYIGFFAYIYNLDSPTIYDSYTDSYSPIDDSVILHDDVFVRIATINSVNMYPHSNNEVNPSANAAIIGWTSVAHRMAIWDYGTNFLSYLMPYPDWGTIKANFMFYRDHGVFDVLTQLPSTTSGTGFYALKLWLRSQLMWDVDQDVDELIKEFMINYYGPAGDAIYEYYEYLKMYFQTLDQANKYKGSMYMNLYSTEFWNFDQMRIFKSLFDKAYQAISHLESINYEEYEIYKKRINTESLFYRYLELELFFNYYQKNDLVNMIDSFENDANVAGLLYLSQLSTSGVPDKILFWRSKL